MSKTKEYFDEWAEEILSAAPSAVVETTYAVHTSLSRSWPRLEIDELIAFDTLEEATAAYEESKALIDTTVQRALGKTYASGSVALCAGLDGIFYQVAAGQMVTIDLAMPGETADGTLRFESDIDDFAQSIIRRYGVVICQCDTDEPSICVWHEDKPFDA